MKLHLTATGCHLSYDFTQCLPATRHKWAHLAVTMHLRALESVGPGPFKTALKTYLHSIQWLSQI